MQIFDSHCHLNDRAYKKDMDTIVARARKADVVSMMIVGITAATSKQAVQLAETYDGCFASVGVHPHDAAECSEDVLAELKTLAKHPRVKAWGETGLDFNRMYSPQPIQEKWFIRQIETAGELQIPLIFHERDSQGRFLTLLSETLGNGQKGVIHCFSGTEKELEAYLDLGFYIGITGILTMDRRGAALRRMAAAIPEDRLLVETDAPYLTPAPEKNRTRRNEPAFVRTVLMKLADIRKKDPRQLSETIWENTCTLFNIG